MNNMTPLENLHYALGEIAYAIANIDGRVQKEEQKKFQAIVEAELRCGDSAFSISDIIFQILNKDKQSAEVSYNWAMEQIRLNGHYLSPELKKCFLSVVEKIAKAYPPVTSSERGLIERFKKDLAGVQGDPVFYQKSF